MKLHSLCVSALFFAGNIFGAAGPSSSLDTIIEEDEPQSITFQLETVVNVRRFDSGVREHVIDLNRNDPYAGVPYRELRHRALAQNLPWLVCVLEQCNLIGFIKSGDCKFKYCDVQSLFEQRIAQGKAVDLSNDGQVEDMLLKMIKHKQGAGRMTYWRPHFIIIDCNDDLSEIVYHDFSDELHETLQLRYTLQADLDALKKMIQLWHRNFESLFSPLRRPLAQEYIISWCKCYLAAIPGDEEVKQIAKVILFGHRNRVLTLAELAYQALVLYPR